MIARNMRCKTLQRVSICTVSNQQNPSNRVGPFGLIKKGSLTFHPCHLEKMISFVELRIKENNSLPHVVFNKIEKILGYAFHYLSIGIAIPVLGIIPGAVRVINWFMPSCG